MGVMTPSCMLLCSTLGSWLFGASKVWIGWRARCTASVMRAGEHGLVR